MSALYASAGQRLLTTGIPWVTLPLAAYLVSSAYAPDFLTDTTMADVPAGALLAGPVGLTGLTAVDGVAGAAVLDFGVLTIGPVAAVLLVDETPGMGALADLLLYFNQGVGFGLAVNGLDCQVVWDTTGVWAP